MLQKRNLIFLSLLILGVFLCTSCLPKPPVTEGMLKGQVMVPEGSLQAKELTGQALPDATVNIIDLATGDIIATTTTDANGYYQVLVPAGGPYLLEAIKDGVKIQQFTSPVEAGIEYNLGIADCGTTASALIAQVMLDAGVDLADINLADIEADPDFDDVVSSVTSIIEAGGDPTESALVQQAVEDFLNPPTPTPTPTPTPLSSDATISAGTLAGVALAGTFTGGADIASSSALTVTIPDASKTNAALALTKGNANSIIKYVKSASAPADDTAYTETYTAGATTITVANGDVIWLLVTAEDTTTKKYYKITVTVAPSSDATLKTASTVKGQTVASLGTPNATLGSEVAGSVTITPEKAADTSNTGTFITLFDKTNAGAIVKVVKYATGVDPTTTFEADTAYANQAITTLDFFIVKVTAEDTTTILYYKVVVTVTLVVGDPYGGGKVAYILQPGENMYDTGDVILYSYEVDVPHGLIAALADQSTGIFWHATNDGTTGATAIALGRGNANTNKIVNLYGGESNAARLCADYTNTETGTGVYSDWYLPSLDELNQLYLNKTAIGGFNEIQYYCYYWSSSESSSTAAWFQGFFGGSQSGAAKDYPQRVRAVRYF